MMPGEQQELQIIMQQKPQGANNLCIFWEVHDFESTIQFEDCLQNKCESFFNRVRIIPPDKISPNADISLNSSFPSTSGNQEVNLRELSERYNHLQRQIQTVLAISVALLAIAIYVALEIRKLNNDCL